MARAQVLRELGVNLEGLAILETGPTNELTTIYAISMTKALYLTWDAQRAGDMVLLRAYLLDRTPLGSPSARR